MKPITGCAAVLALVAACSGPADPTIGEAVPDDPTTVIPSSSPSSSSTPEDDIAATQSTAPPATGTTSTTAVEPSLLELGPGSGFIVLDDPAMVPAAAATWLTPDDVVLGIVHPSGVAHAFPVDQMAYHHIANVTIAGEPYLVTY